MAQLINFNTFTVDNGAVRDLNELLFTSVFKDPALESIIDLSTNVENGKHIGYVDNIGDVGTKSAGCKPTYAKAQINGFEKKWELGEWNIPIEFCYKELSNTLAKYGMKPGTERGDLQNTPYWDKLVIPLLQKAITEMFWRLVWFGDTEAKDTGSSGVIKEGVDTALFTPCDGLWKRLQAIIAANANQKTTIAANQEISYALQKSKIRESGVAIGIVDNMLVDADGRIFDKDHALFMTNSLFKALRTDLFERSKYQLTTEKLMEGVLLSEYDGQTVIVLDIWDRMIKKYEDNGTKFNLPHRAFLAPIDNLMVGTSDDNLFSQLDINFDHKERQNYIFASGDLGTMVGEDELVQVAL